MHYRLTVLWIFIVWELVGITESRPQNEPHLDRGSWKPFIPSNPERIPPQPSVDQHNSRYNTKNLYQYGNNTKQLLSNNKNFNNTLKLFLNSLNNTFNEHSKNILHKLITNYTQLTKTDNSTVINLNFFERIRSLMTNNKNDITIVNNFLQNNIPDLFQTNNITQKLTKNIINKSKSNNPKIWPNTDIINDDSLDYYMNYTNLFFNRKPNLRRKNNTAICPKAKQNCNTQSKVKPTMTVPIKTPFTPQSNTQNKVKPTITVPIKNSFTPQSKVKPTITVPIKNHFTPQINTNRKKTPPINTKAVPLLVTTKLTRPLKDIITPTEIPSPITVTSQNTYNIDTGNIPYTVKPNKKSNGRCPTVYITALTTVHGNNTILSREECSDLNIVIDSQIHNNNLIKDHRPAAASATPLQAPETANPVAHAGDQVPLDSDSVVTNAQSDTALAPASDAASSTTNNFNIRPPLRPPFNQNGGNAEEDPQADESLVTTMIDSFTTPSTWLDTLNPLLGILLTPLSVIAVGGLSLIALLFPFSLPNLLISRSARKYPKIDQNRHDYVDHKPINGWYWHDGYKTWSNRPPKNDEFDRRILDESIDRVRIENEQEKNEVSHRQSRLDKVPVEHTTVRQNKAASPAIRDSIKAVTNQLLDPSNVTLDTRTPPKIKAHHKTSIEKIKPANVIENSHAGIAVPVHEDEIKELEDQTKKIVIHHNHNKIQSTTDSGLSTWILLSGQPSTTMKTVTKPEPNKENKTEKHRINNKMRTTTRRPIATTTESYAEVTDITAIANNTKLVNKIKASILANSMKEKHGSTASTTLKPQITTTMKNLKTNSKKNTTSDTTSNVEQKIEEKVNSSVSLPIEAKDGDLDLTTESTNKKSVSTKKPPRSTTTATKRKKNKNRRKRPSSNKTVNGTKTAIKPQTKEKPISTQVYNYLSREVLPTVGVGLVGLMVTAGLASYFLYPFGVAARRAYTIADRKDDKYYYNNGDYGYGGQPEEDVINKVVAGMPASSSGLQEYIYTKPTNENRYKSPYQETPETQQNVRYRQSNSPSYPTYSASYSQDKVSYNQINKYSGQNDNTFNFNTDYSTPTYGADIIAEHQKESGYTVSGIASGNEMNAQKFVVGNIPKDIIVTPAAVPEHGPRSLKIRRRRRRNTLEKHSKSIENNEIMDDIHSNNVQLSGGFISNNLNLPSIDQNNTFNPTPSIEIAQKNTNVTKLSLIPQKPSQLSEIPSQIAEIPSQIAEIPSNLPIPIDSGLSIFSFFKSLLEFKMRLGLSIMQHMTEALGRYIHSTMPPTKPQYDEVNMRRPTTLNSTQHQKNKNETVIKREFNFYN